MIENHFPNIPTVRPQLAPAIIHQQIHSARRHHGIPTVPDTGINRRGLRLPAPEASGLPFCPPIHGFVLLRGRRIFKVAEENCAEERICTRAKGCCDRGGLQEIT